MSSIEERRRAARLMPLAAAWRCDLATGKLAWSPGVYELFGISPGAELDRDAIVEMYSEESRAVLARVRADAIARRTSFLFDAQIRRADGEMRWMRVTADVACKGGEPVQLYGVKQDITEEVARGLPVFTGPVG
jgi:PAS domain S-box-containing protein